MHTLFDLKAEAETFRAEESPATMLFKRSSHAVDIR